MKPSDKLKAKLAEKVKAAKDALTAARAKAETDGVGLSAEAIAADDAAHAEADALRAQIRIEERAEREELETPAAATLVRVSVSEPGSARDPRKGFRSHREFLAAAMGDAGARARDQVGDERLRPLAQFDREDKQAAGAVAFMLPEAFTPASLRATAGSDEHGMYDYGSGGVTAVTTRMPGILSVGFEGDPTAGRTQPVPMTSPTVEMLARVDKDHSSTVSGGLSWGRKAETVAAAASRTSLELVTLKASSLFGLSYATEELLSDSPVSWLALIEAGFSEQLAAHLLSEKLRGKGGTEFLGILTALASANLGPTISIAKEAGQAADTIVYQNTIKMRARCWGYGNAIWLANHDAYPQLAVLAVPVGVGGQLVYQQSQVEDRPDMLLGRPIYYSEYASTLGDQGDLILGNWSQYLDGLYQPMQSAESIHVRFLNHERAFKFWIRNAAAPWWKSALTPNKGANTLAPFVVLDAR